MCELGVCELIRGLESRLMVDGELGDWKGGKWKIGKLIGQISDIVIQF